MITISGIDEAGVPTGQTRQIEDEAGCPAGWVRGVAPPAPPAGRQWAWSAGAWQAQPITGPSVDLARLALRDRLDAVFEANNTANFPWDFGGAQALDDLGASVGPAGVRSLQIRGLEDKTNWTAVHSAAIAAVVGGQAGLIVPIKCDDNVWVQTTAMDVLTVLTVGRTGAPGLLARQSQILARYGALKKQIAEAPNLAAVDAIDINAGWPA